MMKHITTTYLLSNIIFLISIVIGFIIDENELMGEWALFYFYNCILLIYLLFFLHVVCIHSNGWRILTIWYIMFQFIVFSVLGNIVFFFDTSMMYFEGNAIHPSIHFMNKSMILTCLGAFSIINFYYNDQFFIRLGKTLSHNIGFLNDKINYTISPLKCFFVFLLSYCVAFYALSLGIIGYTTEDAASFISTGQYYSVAQYFVYIIAFMQIVLYLYYYEFLIKKWKCNNLNFLVLIVYFVLFFSYIIMIGSKGTLVFSFGTLFLIYYLVRKRINKSLLGISALSLFFAYNFVQYFRNLLRSGFYDSFYDRFIALFTSLSNVFVESGIVNNEPISDFLYKLAYRLTNTDDGALVIRYADEIGLTAGDPNFLLDFLLAPFTSFLPRIVFPWKSTYEYGSWAAHTVFNIPYYIYTSNDLSTHGYFYLAGGIIFVIVGYICMGILLNFCSGIVFSKNNNVLKIVSFTVIISNILFSSASPPEIVAGILRAIIIFPIMCRFLLKKDKKK